MMVYTVCSEQADEIEDCAACMWSVCYSSLEEAKSVVEENWTNILDDMDLLRDGCATWEPHSVRDECHILDDSGLTGVVWTIMQAELKHTNEEEDDHAL